MSGWGTKAEIVLEDTNGNVIIQKRDVARAPVPGVPIDKEKLKKALVKYQGNVTKTAVSLGVARQSIERICRTDPEVKAALEDARERTIDLVEDAFIKRAIAGDTTASIFFLKTRGRNRGYDQDMRADMEAVARAALSFALNNSRNPAE